MTPAIMPREPDQDPARAIAALEDEARACRHCAAHLPLGPRPIFRISTTARLLIASQAPGTKAHLSGIPFDDASGVRLRSWLGIPDEVFYDKAQVAIVPMGFCYPGRLANGGDAPPRPECAPLWRARMLASLASLRLTLVVGTWSQAWMFGRGTMTERVREHRRFLPQYFPLPHPSWRTGVWETRNPWFGTDTLPALRAAVANVLA